MEKSIPAIDEQIYDSLWSLFLSHKPVRLLNVFHGIPISYEVTIAMISQSYLGLSVHRHQAVCISIERFTYLHSERLPFAVHAHALAVDVGEGEVILDRLAAVSDHYGNRTNLRVQPKEPIFIDIQNNGKKYAASLADLSLQGMDKFTLAVLAENEINLRQNQEVDLSLKLPGTNTPLHLCGVAGRGGFDQKRKLNRINIQISPDPSSQSVITDYISQRQAEIMQELEFIYKSKRKPQLQI